RDGLDELEQELDQADEQVDRARRDALLEPAEDEELAEVAAHAEAAEALVVEVEKGDDSEPDSDVHVAARGPEELQLAEKWQQPTPVREQDEQEERREERDVPSGIGAPKRDRPVLEALPGELERVLHPARDRLEPAPGDDE